MENGLESPKRGVKRERSDEVVKGKEKEEGCNVGNEKHVWSERERRKKMKEMFNNLQSLLPHLPDKVDKITLVDEAAKHIQSLQDTLQKLQAQKLKSIRNKNLYEAAEMKPTLASFAGETSLSDQAMNWALGEPSPAVSSSNEIVQASIGFSTWSSPSVVVSICGNYAQISVCAAKKLGLLAAVLRVLEEHKLDLITAQVSANDFKFMCMLFVQANWAFDQYLDGINIEEVYKSVAEDIIMRILS